ncbi:MAG: N-acyl homoserine lactonase family protein [Chloroflexota bacterium]|nr:N-acyl homoserine lactonase family protein [Chloroflexota bacterium]
MIELTLLRTGQVDLPRSTFFPDGGPEVTRIPVWSGLLRTGEGVVLFDTGLHPVHIDRPDATYGPQSSVKPVMSRDDAIVPRLASIGVRPDDVAIVVNSHLHFDHAGNNGAFPKATFIVQGDHLAFAKGKPNFPGVYWDIPELTYLPVSGRTRVARGLEVVPTPGHAPGHQSLVVDLPETGRVVLSGDAAFTRENLERGEIRAPDEAAAKDSLRLIRSLVKDDLDRVFTSHDAASWPRWQHAPETYR